MQIIRKFYSGRKKGTEPSGSVPLFYVCIPAGYPPKGPYLAFRAAFSPAMMPKVVLMEIEEPLAGYSL